MTNWTVVVVVRRGDFRILGIIDGSYGTKGSPALDEDTEIFTHIIAAETREDAEALVRSRYFPAEEAPKEEPTC